MFSNDPEALTNLLARQGSQIAAGGGAMLGSGAIPLMRSTSRSCCGYGPVWIPLVADGRDQFGHTDRWFASRVAGSTRPDDRVKGLSNGAAAIGGGAGQCSGGRLSSARVCSRSMRQAGTPPSCAAITATIGQMHALDAVAAAARCPNRLMRR